MAGRELVEGLEDRRLMSVSASTLIGSALKTGTTFKYEVISGKKVTGEFIQTVKGSVKFNGIKCTEIDTSSVSGKTTKLFSKEYVGVDSKKNYVSYGSVTFAGTSKTTETVKPAEISYPAALAAGKAFSSTTTETESTVTPNLPATKSTSKKTLTVKLLSSKRVTVKVPAGTFSAYELTNTTTTGTGATATKTTSTIWVVPGRGVVKIVNGTGSTASTIEQIK